MEVRQLQVSERGVEELILWHDLVLGTQHGWNLTTCLRLARECWGFEEVRDVNLFDVKTSSDACRSPAPGTFLVQSIDVALIRQLASGSDRCAA
eukprot:3729928-Pleurochrysis_carterae.AAC.1